MEECREYGHAAESYEKLLTIKETGLSSGQLLLILPEWSVTKSRDWSTVLRSLEEQRPCNVIEYSII